MVNDSIAGVVNTTLTATLGELNSRLGCRFCLETLELEGAVNPKSIQPVDFDAINGGTDPVLFIQDRFPSYKVEKIQGRPQFYRVYDVRILQCSNYPLQAIVENFTFDGTQSQLLEKLAMLNPNTSPIVACTPEQSLFAIGGGEHVAISLPSGNLRDALIRGCVFPSEFSTLWWSHATGTLISTKIKMGFAGYSSVLEP